MCDLCTCACARNREPSDRVAQVEVPQPRGQHHSQHVTGSNMFLFHDMKEITSTSFCRLASLSLIPQLLSSLWCEDEASRKVLET